jgi:hypothetical protein
MLQIERSLREARKFRDRPAVRIHPRAPGCVVRFAQLELGFAVRGDAGMWVQIYEQAVLQPRGFSIPLVDSRNPNRSGGQRECCVSCQDS